MNSIQQNKLNATQLLLGHLINESITVTQIAEETGIAANCIRRYAEGKVQATPDDFGKMEELLNRSLAGYAEDSVTNHADKHGE